MPIVRQAHHKKKNGWKDVQSKRQIARKTKLASVALIIVLLFLVLSQAVKFTQTLFSPWKTPSAKSYLWNGDFNLNFLIRSRGVAFVSFNPKDQKIIIVNIPSSTFVETAQGFGKWQLASIYDLGETGKLGGDTLLNLSLTNFFGLPIDGILDFSGKYATLSASELVDEIRKTPVSIVGLLSNLKTDLTPYELMRLNLSLSGVRFDKKTEINLDKIGVLEQSKLADGSPVYILDDQKLDAALVDAIDPQISGEHKTIAVFNSTDHPALGKRGSRLITNLGGDVIIVTNSETKLSKTLIYGEKSKTLERLKQAFGIDDKQSLPFSDEKLKIDPKLKDQILTRAQINVFLGEDYFTNQ